MGNWCSLISIVSLVFFLGANYINDRISPPQIRQITFEPQSPKINQIIKLQAEVFDRDNDFISYTWSYAGKVFSNEKIAYWKTPESPGRYTIDLNITDNPKEDTAGKQKGTVKKEVGIMVTKDDGKVTFIADLLNLSVSKLDETNLKKALSKGSKLTKATVSFDDSLRGWLQKRLDKNIQSIETLKAHPNLLTDTLKSLIDNIDKIEDEDVAHFFNREKLPPCSKYPMFWPFCNPKE